MRTWPSSDCSNGCGNEIVAAAAKRVRHGRQAHTRVMRGHHRLPWPHRLGWTQRSLKALLPSALSLTRPRPTFPSRQTVSGLEHCPSLEELHVSQQRLPPGTPLAFAPASVAALSVSLRVLTAGASFRLAVYSCCCSAASKRIAARTCSSRDAPLATTVRAPPFLALLPNISHPASLHAAPPAPCPLPPAPCPLPPAPLTRAAPCRPVQHQQRQCGPAARPVAAAAAGPVTQRAGQLRGAGPRAAALRGAGQPGPEGEPAVQVGASATVRCACGARLGGRETERRVLVGACVRVCMFVCACTLCKCVCV